MPIVANIIIKVTMTTKNLQKDVILPPILALCDHPNKLKNIGLL